MLLEKDGLKVRCLQAKDKHSLVKWLSTPFVLEFYEGRDNSFDLEKVNEEFYKDKDVKKCIIEYKGVSIGYIQFYEVNERTSTIDDYDSGEIIYGMDQFFGEPAFWNRGIGTLLVDAMAHYLVKERQADRVIMDPQITNTRAIKCYEKAGFTKVRLLPKHEFHEGAYRDSWLMEFRNRKE